MIEAVAHHHHPERVPHDKLDMLSVVYLSNLLAHKHSADKGIFYLSEEGPHSKGRTD